ncbi:hypothetical protein TIFTF001_023941 [Ficus carica]|uniref:Uncharacterized protein n=1 Tax=Ficus carica TaxID=3494 RepID=A0AA88AH48_FICCA|nr:hypothetical protein TIFTF001_023941 [Ficus carica]
MSRKVKSFHKDSRFTHFLKKRTSYFRTTISTTHLSPSFVRIISSPNPNSIAKSQKEKKLFDAQKRHTRIAEFHIRSFRIRGGNDLVLLGLEALEGLLVGPGLDGEIGLGVEADAENDDGEKAGDVAGELPVLPLAGLARRRRRPVEEVTLRPLLVARRGPAAGAGVSAAAGAEGGEETVPEHGGKGCCRRESVEGSNDDEREREREWSPVLSRD